MKLPLFRINESEDPRVAEGMARVAKIDGDIAALKKRIAELEDDKSNIQTEIAKVTGQDAQEQQDQGGQNQEQMIQQAVAAATAAVTGGTNESLVERLDPTMDEEDRINMLMDELSDEIVYYLNNDPENPRVREIKNELRDLQDELAQLEMDQMDHEDSYEDLEDPIYEGYASKFRPGKMEWKGRTYNINKVENVNDKMDIVYVDGKSMSSKHLESTGAEMVKKPRPEREKRMTKREYERTLKDTMRSVKSDMGDAIDHSIIYDLAENLYYDPEVKNYVVRRWKKENGYTEWYDTKEPSRHDIIEQITNDLEMNESVSSKKNFRELKEAYVERTSKVDDDYEDDDYVFYIRINEKGNEFIGKIYKLSPDGDWYGVVKEGQSKTFKKISYPPEYDEMDIIEFLGENYDKVEIIGSDEFNEYIEDEEDEIDEDIIGGSAWPTNTI